MVVPREELSGIIETVIIIYPEFPVFGLLS